MYNVVLMISFTILNNGLKSVALHWEISCASDTRRVPQGLQGGVALLRPPWGSGVPVRWPLTYRHQGAMHKVRGLLNNVA